METEHSTIEELAPSLQFRELLHRQASRYGVSMGTIIRAYAILLDKSAVTVAQWRYGDGVGRGIPLAILTFLEEHERVHDLTPILNRKGVNSGKIWKKKGSL